MNVPKERVTARDEDREAAAERRADPAAEASRRREKVGCFRAVRTRTRSFRRASVTGRILVLDVGVRHGEEQLRRRATIAVGLLLAERWILADVVRRVVMREKLRHLDTGARVHGCLRCPIDIRVDDQDEYQRNVEREHRGEDLIVELRVDFTDRKTFGWTWRRKG